MLTPETLATDALAKAFAVERHWNEATFMPHITAAIREAVEQERERCAQIAEDEWVSMDHVVGYRIAAAIRALD